MPRFGIKTILIATTFVALWLSTASGYAAQFDVRRSVLLLIMVAAGFAAIYGRGRRRAFWAGFFSVMLLCGTSGYQVFMNRYVPTFDWLAVPTTPGPYYSAPPTPAPALSPAPPANGQQVVIMPVPMPAYAGPTSSPFVMATIPAAWLLCLSLLGGFIAAYIYDQSRKTDTP